MTRGSRSRVRGFTLIELLVALTGGLFVSIAVFALARDASRFYQREGRLANATLGALVGFERLRADIARAGFLASPNVRIDRDVCSRPLPDAPALLANLASVRIASPDPDLSNATLLANGISPDRVRLAGSYSSTDEFPISLIEQPVAGGEYRVYLQVESGPMARLGYSAAPDAGEKKRLLIGVFAPGRGLRIVDKQGRTHYGLIDDVLVDAPGREPYIRLEAQPALTFRDQSASQRLCGLSGMETGATANVINFIQYDLRNLNTASHFSSPNAAYAALYTSSGTAPYEADRTELVRTELDASAQPMTLIETMPDESQRTTQLEELVAEYAVDLRLELTIADNNGTSDPSVRHAGSDIADFIGDTGGAPERIRAVRVRLSVRSREADRETAIAGFGGNLFRIGLGPSGGAPFARVRTLQADVVLNNHTSLQW